jgi:carbonic anhydrase
MAHLFRQVGFSFSIQFHLKRRIPMSVTDQVLAANQKYANKFNQGDLAMPPARKLAVLACMDARIHVEDALALELGDAHVIRNAGGIASEDAVRSLIISHHLLGTQEFVVINHTDCGMLTFRDHELAERLERESGQAAVAPIHFHSFKDIEANVRQQVSRIRNHPWIPEQITVRGFVYDVKTGRLHEVQPTSLARTA